MRPPFTTTTALDSRHAPHSALGFRERPSPPALSLPPLSPLHSNVPFHLPTSISFVQGHGPPYSTHPCPEEPPYPTLPYPLARSTPAMMPFSWREGDR